MSRTEVSRTTVDLLRHGDCEGGAIYRGVTDSPLSPLGWLQMEKALANLGGWQAVVTSPLARCRAFAKTFAAKAALPLEEDRSFREVHFGVWEGRTIDDVWREERELAEAYYAEPGSVTPAGGESLAAASERVAAAWQALLQRYRGQHLLVVAHGGVIRLLLSHALGAPLKTCVNWEISHGSLARLTVYHGDPNDLCRLTMLRPGEPAS